MKFYEKLDHKLREYQYKRKRRSSGDQDENELAVGEFLDEVDAYVEEVMEEIGQKVRKR